MPGQLAVLAANVRALREQRHMTQEELAFAARIHRTHLSKIERQLCDPGATVLARLAAALDVAPGPLLEAEPD